MKKLHDTPSMVAKGILRNGKTYLLTVGGEALTVARVNMQLAQEDVAHRLGVNKSQICRWEQGLNQPPMAKIFELVELFGVNDFVRLNEKAAITKDEATVIRGLREELVVGRLNGRAVLTAEEIEVVRKLREG